MNTMASTAGKYSFHTRRAVSWPPKSTAVMLIPPMDSSSVAVERERNEDEKEEME